MILLLIIILLFAAYASLIFYYWQSWIRIPVFVSPGVEPNKAVTVVIPARNEEQNIGRLLQALGEQQYPKHLLEIIVVDDHSTDQTASVVSEWKNVTLVKLEAGRGSNSFKKMAIEKGIASASHDWIATTDADCVPAAGWLRQLAAIKQNNNAGFIVAPVVYDCSSRPLEVFQAMDFMVLQGITGAAVFRKKLSMCNGANLAYDKHLFYEVDGFSGIDHIASGDDMLLMHKIASRYPDTVHYLKSKDAIVHTQPMPTWKDFFNQRIRWASKATHYDDKRIMAVLLLVYFFNLSFPVLLVAGFWNPVYWFYFLWLWVLKTLVELPFFYSLAKFFDKGWAVKLFFFFQPLHIVYTLVSGLLGQFGNYEWKGRRVK